MFIGFKKGKSMGDVEVLAEPPRVKATKVCRVRCGKKMSELFGIEARKCEEVVLKS